MKNFNKNSLIWLIVVFTAFAIFSASQDGVMGGNRTLSYSEFLDQVEAGTLTNVKISGNNLQGMASDGQSVASVAPYDPDLIANLRKHGVNIAVESSEGNSLLVSIFLQLLPILVIVALWLFFMKQMQGGGKGGALSFGKSRAQLLTQNDIKVTFKDVAGVEEAKAELEEVVEFLKDPGKFQRLGGKIPKGALLVGSPGTGKTLLARAVAGEAGVPFFTISGSDFVEMFVGVGASRVRDLFEQAKKNSPCIVFIDEIDAVGRHRGAGHGGGNDEREQTLNQLLVEMDGFTSSEGVILIAATNRPDVLDPALMRPGRFDRQVTVPLPDIKGRTSIIEVHMQKVPLGADVDAEVLARGTPGFSGADLANLVNEAALMAARRNKRLVDMADFESAKDKVMMGAERRSAVITEEQKRTTAYHEAGHAIVTQFIDGPKDPLHKVTIIPRGRALGVTMSLPEDVKVTYDVKYLENQIAILYGGRLAEELVLDQMTTGASNDIEKASELARNMVCAWGMSKKLGPINFNGSGHGEPLWGRSNAASGIAQATAAEVDAEIKRIIEAGYARAKKCLEKHNKELHELSEALIEHETLDAAQMKELFAGKKVTAKKESRREKKMAEKKETGSKVEAKKPAAKKTTAKKTDSKKKD